MQVPFFQPSITDAEVEDVVACLRSGWLTTGSRAKEFEAEFARYVGGKHAVAVNSCTAALHLALEAAGVRRGDRVLVPTFTFAATAEVVRYFDAIPVFVDSEPVTLCMDPEAAGRMLEDLAAGREPEAAKGPGPVRAVLPVHYGGQMADVAAFRRLGTVHDAAVIEDAAHTLPAYHREGADAPWRSAGSTADVTCFSFYANKCITTGEGGMAVTDREDWADRMRVMSLHGMSRDAWRRFTTAGSWHYEIVAPGFKYNLTDVAAALGLRQLTRADALWEGRRRAAQRLLEGLGAIGELVLPVELPDRRHSWHLFPVRLVLEKLTIDRAAFIDALRANGVAASVHWMPLHLQPYYARLFEHPPDAFPVAWEAWPRLVSLPIFPSMTEAQLDHVIAAVTTVVASHRRRH